MPDTIPADADRDAILAVTRAGNPELQITDYSYDGAALAAYPTVTYTESVTDPRGIVARTGYDARNRAVVRIAATGTDAEAVVERRYDAAGNMVAEIDPLGVETHYTYTAFDLVAAEIRDATGEDPVVTTFTYNADTTARSRTDALGYTWRTRYHECCQDVQAQIDPTGAGTIRNQDRLGRVTHTATVDGLPLDPNEAYDWLNPDDAAVHETTTRYDVRGRPTHQTRWLVPLATLNPDQPPIAGEDGREATDGLTTRYQYDDDLRDGLDISIPYTVDLTTMPIDDEAWFSAAAVTNPEGETTLTIRDGLGRTVQTYNGLGHKTTATYDDLSTGDDTTDRGTAVPAGLVVTAHTDATDAATATYTDGANRTRFVRDAESHWQERVFDANGNILS